MHRIMCWGVHAREQRNPPCFRVGKHGRHDRHPPAAGSLDGESPAKLKHEIHCHAVLAPYHVLG